MSAMSMVEQWVTASSKLGLAGATDEELDAAAASLGVDLPKDYRAMMRRANGGEAEFGDSWIRFWRVQDLTERNADYRVQEFAPGFTYFGTNGGGEAYAWDSRPNRKAEYVVIPFIGLDEETVVPCGNTLEEFLATLHRGIPFERSGE